MRKFIVLVLGLLSFCLALAAVNLNTASKEELETLNGIGPSKAQAIIDYRTKNGGFKTIEDIKKVQGIGDKTFEKLKGDLTVSGKTAVEPAKKSPTPAKATPAAKVTKPAAAK